MRPFKNILFLLVVFVVMLDPLRGLEHGAHNNKLQTTAFQIIGPRFTDDPGNKCSMKDNSTCDYPWTCCPTNSSASGGNKGICGFCLPDMHCCGLMGDEKIPLCCHNLYPVCCVNQDPPTCCEENQVCCPTGCCDP